MNKIQTLSRHGNGFLRSAAIIVLMGAVWTYQIAQFL